MNDKSIRDAGLRRPPRDSNIELLRILSMLMIIGHHFISYSGFNLTVFTPEAVSLQLLLGGKLGVNIFVLISGYYLVTSERNWRRLILLILEVLFYSLLGYAAATIFLGTPFRVEELYQAAMPLSHSIYWFATVYVILYLLAPYLNIQIHAMNQRQHAALAIILFLLFCLIPLATQNQWTFAVSDTAWFITLYIISSYVRLYSFPGKDKTILWFLLALVDAIFLVAVTIFYDALGAYSMAFCSFFSDNRLLYALGALFLFLGFRNVKIPKSRIINTIAASCFGVYLIHENRWTNHWLWDNVVRAARYEGTPYLILYSAAAILVVFSACTLLDFVRRATVERLTRVVMERLAPAAVQIRDRLDRRFFSKWIEPQ